MQHHVQPVVELIFLEIDVEGRPAFIRTREREAQGPESDESDCPLHDQLRKTVQSIDAEVTPQSVRSVESSSVGQLPGRQRSEPERSRETSC